MYFPMKTLSILLFSLIFIAEAYAQRPANYKYWVFLRDKAGPAGKTAAVEGDRLTPAALTRRSLRATRIPADRDTPLSTSYLRRLREEGIQPLVQSRWLNAVSAILSEEQVREVQVLPFVKSVHPVGRLDPPHETVPSLLPEAAPIADIRMPNRLDYGPSLTQLEMVNAVPPLEEGLNGAGVKLGIIDTGMGNLPSTHPATSLMNQEGRFVESQDFTGLPADNSRHGYSVLSVAAGFDEGQLIGPAYGAEVYHARTEYTPTETNQEEDNFVAGIEWMESQGVDIVNVSLGYSEFDFGESSYSTSDMDGDTGITTIAADMAVEMGMVVVVSAGNSGCSSPVSCWYFITTPADGDSVITVGAVDPSGSLVGFSSRGPTADGRTKPDVAAQGFSVYLASSSSNYTQSNGTSFASPMVAGVAALLLQVNPDLTPIEIREILRNTASQANSPNDFLGWGIIDAEAAVNEARTRSVSTPDEPRIHPLTMTPPYPNPFVDRTTLTINNEGPSVPARLVVFNALGQAVYAPFEGLLTAGNHRISIDLSQQASGLYFYRLETNGGVQSGTLVRF